MINDLFDMVALDAPVLDQCRRQCFDGGPMRQQHRQRPVNEALLVVAAEAAQISHHACGKRQVSVRVAVQLRERQHLAPAPLAAMDRLGDAPGKVDRDLRFHQKAVAWRDAALWPCGRIDVRPDAVACPLAGRGLHDLDGPDANRRRRVRQPSGISERHQDADGVASLVRDAKQALVTVSACTLRAVLCSRLQFADGPGLIYRQIDFLFGQLAPFHSLQRLYEACSSAVRCFSVAAASVSCFMSSALCRTGCRLRKVARFDELLVYRSPMARACSSDRLISCSVSLRPFIRSHV